MVDDITPSNAAITAASTAEPLDYEAIIADALATPTDTEHFLGDDVNMTQDAMAEFDSNRVSLASLAMVVQSVSREKTLSYESLLFVKHATNDVLRRMGSSVSELTPALESLTIASSPADNHRVAFESINGLLGKISKALAVLKANAN